MARVSVPLSTLEAGQFPPVCCRTGEHTTTYAPWHLGSGFTGILPISPGALRRVRLLRWTGGGLLLIAAAVLMGSLAANTTETLGPPRTWALAALAVGVVAAIAMVAAALSSPGAKRMDENVDLKRIDERFAAAVVSARGEGA